MWWEHSPAPKRLWLRAKEFLRHTFSSLLCAQVADEGAINDASGARKRGCEVCACLGCCNSGVIKLRRVGVEASGVLLCPCGKLTLKIQEILWEKNNCTALCDRGERRNK